MVACPRSSCTNLGCTPRPSSSVAQVCRRSWKRISGRPAFLSNGLKDRFTRFSGLVSMPTLVAKIRSKFGDELLRMIERMLGAAPWPPNPAKVPNGLNLLVTLVGWRPSENLSQRPRCSARRSLAKWSSLDCPKQMWTKRRQRCSHGRRSGGLESRPGCWSAGRS
jgi:hypothetical protein